MKRSGRGVTPGGSNPLWVAGRGGGSEQSIDHILTSRRGASEKGGHGLVSAPAGMVVAMKVSQDQQ